MDANNPIEFIKVLKSQHQSIISTVHEIDSQQGGAIDLKNALDKLNRITDLLFDHLEKEDKQLYPALLSDEKTTPLAKKYYYDMERLSCIALDFFKRYCVNREGLKIFVEDFVNSYSLFKGLLKLRIKREELELYPAYILLYSGVLYSEVADSIKKDEQQKQEKSKKIFVYGENPASLEALTLALEMNDYKIQATKFSNQIVQALDSTDINLILLDVTNASKELNDTIKYIKTKSQDKVKIVGFSSDLLSGLNEDTLEKLDDFIPRPALDIEDFSDKIRELLKV